MVGVLFRVGNIERFLRAGSSSLIELTLASTGGPRKEPGGPMVDPGRNCCSTCSAFWQADSRQGRDYVTIAGALFKSMGDRTAIVTRN